MFAPSSHTKSPTQPNPPWAQPWEHHLQRLQQQTAAIAVWLVYWDFANGQRQQQQAINRHHNGYTSPLWALLTSEVQTCCTEPHNSWGTLSAIPATGLHRWTSESLAPQHVIYLYPCHSPVPGETYVGIWCDRPLEPAALCTLNQTLALLESCLGAMQTIQQQGTRLQTLQETLKRSRHQLRQPLALIRLYADTLALGLADHPLRNQVSVISETAQELSENLTKLLSLHDQGELQWQQVELHDIVQAVVEQLSERWRSRNLTIQIPDITVQLWGDEWRLKQVFDVLLQNAIAFSPPSSTITWDWQVKPQQIQITVRDRGPGIEPGQQQEIFQPFYSQRPGGSGLGLAIAQDVVRQHYGHIWVENHPRSGAQFCLTLPNHNQNNTIGVLGEFRL